MSWTCPILGCGQTLESGSPAARKAHCAESHGYPTCGVCGTEHKNVRMFEDHLKKPHDTQPCDICKADVVVGTEKDHVARIHGFPECTFCHEQFKRFDKFTLHLLAHSFAPCQYPDCSAQVARGCEEQHARDAHGYPVCPRCDETILPHWSNFYVHVKRAKCEAAVMRPCPYTDCTATVYTNRPELTRQHLLDAHGGMVCLNCGHETDNVYTPIVGFLKHVERCYNTSQSVLSKRKRSQQARPLDKKSCIVNTHTMRNNADEPPKEEQSVVLPVRSPHSLESVGNKKNLPIDEFVEMVLQQEDETTLCSNMALAEVIIDFFNETRRQAEHQMVEQLCLEAMQAALAEKVELARKLRAVDDMKVRHPESADALTPWAPDSIAGSPRTQQLVERLQKIHFDMAISVSLHGIVAEKVRQDFVYYKELVFKSDCKPVLDKCERLLALFPTAPTHTNSVMF